MVDYQTISIVFTGLSISLAAFYYISTLRNSQRNQELSRKAQEQQLETRQAQLFNTNALHMLTGNFMEEYTELLNWEWNDYHDFETKYGSDNNPKAFAMRCRIWGYFNGIGKYLREGLIKIDLVNTLISDTATFQWYKWKDVIYEQRKRYYTENFLAEWEYLVSELLKYKAKLGFQWTPPETLGKYIPDNE